MPRLADEICLIVRWPHKPEDTQAVAARESDLPLSREAVVGRHEVKAETSYEVLLLSGRHEILHVTGRLPDECGHDFITAEAWIRCQVSEAGECGYEIHVGPAGLTQAKACHKGRMSLHVV